MARVCACMRAPAVKGGVALQSTALVRSPPKERIGAWPCRVGTCLHRSRLETRTQLVSGRCPAASPVRPSIPLAAGATFRRRDPSIIRRLSAQRILGHAPPGPAPAASGRSGNSGSQAQATRAPVGTRPVLANRHRATRSFRASATIMILRIRPRAPVVRAWNHWLSALSGW